MEWRIKRYENIDEVQWDSFIQNESINGTFLQERRFLNYHKEGRFVDESLMFFSEDELVAVCPGCEVYEDGVKTFFSHKGSSYGGFVVKKSIYTVEKIVAMISEFEKYLIEHQYKKCVLKPTLKLLSTENTDLLEYCLYYKKYREYKELDFYIDYQTCKAEMMNNLSNMKKRLVKKCINAGLEMKELTQKEEIADFHRILSENLKKFDTAPVHTVEELWDLYQNRLPEEMKFYGAYLDGKMLAGTMVFLFHKTKCAHTQYLASDLSYNKLSPMSFIYYAVAKLYQELGYKTLSWGIATEHLGLEINEGLIKNKESFGSTYAVNYIFEKNL